MPDLDRRQFFGALGSGAATRWLPAGQPEPKPRRLWIDPRIESLPARPWRKIHLDFHNSEHVKKIGEKFNAQEFGDRLLAANVNAIVVFAKDMHGYFYYPSRYGPVHPGLSFDLLGEQVKACRERKIEVYAYYCTTWDNYLAGKRREWLVIKRDGTNYLPKPGAPPGWTALCLAHEAFVRLMLDHTKEFVSRYELNGAWFDMPVPVAGECFCAECLRQLKEQGLNPRDVKAQREHKHALHKSFIERATQTVKTTRPGCLVDYNGQGVYGLGERARFMDNIDIEALPTAFWGYWYSPTIVRYTRNFGLTTYGMSGRFKSSWADFGGLKLPAQLETEVASIVANGARCDLGDQMPPNGRLDPAVYHVIGKAYGYIRKLEPYLEGAAPVTEAALVTGGLPLDKLSTDGNYGLVRLLMESRVQFDVVEPDVPWERYGLIVLPDAMRLDARLAARLEAYLDGGGAVMASHESGLLADAERSWLERRGIRFEGMSKFKPAYMIPKENFTGDIPAYEYALYEGASQWIAQAPARTVAALGEPAFQRSGAQYTSHKQTPFEKETPFAAIAVSGKAALFGFPLGLSYMNEGYWVYRNAFQHVLKGLLAAPVVESSAPLSTEITVTRQPARGNRKERYLVHVVNFSPLRKGPKHPEFHEDPIPLTNIRVRLNVGRAFTSARAAVAGVPLAMRRAPGGAEVTLPKVAIHEIVCFE